MIERITHDTKEFLNSIKDTKPIQEKGYEGARADLARLQSKQAFQEDVARNDYEVMLKDESTIHVRVVRPLAEKGNLPMVFYIHGGGWVMGDAMCYDHLLRKLAKHGNCAVVFPEYSLAPHARFPRPLKELWSVLEYIIAHPHTFNIDPHHIIIAGDSAGGNMATVLASYAIERGVQIHFQMLFYPVISMQMNTLSYQEFAQGPYLTRSAMEWFCDAYQPDINVRNQAQIAPIYLAPDKMKKLPPALIITAENDVLRDEGAAYALALKSVGVEAVCVRINGTIHDFMMLAPLAHSLETQVAYALVIGMIQKIFKEKIQ